MTDDQKTTSDSHVLLEQWKTIVSAQMHFNDMILRTRSLGITVVIAVYGAAAASIGQFPNQMIPILGRGVHISALIVLLGLVLLSSVFILDFFYYYRLLLGAVGRGQEVENELSTLSKDGLKTRVDLAGHLTLHVSRDTATLLIILFYAVSFVFGLMFFFYMFSCYVPAASRSAA